MLRSIFSYTEFNADHLFARCNLPKSFLEELETVDKINFSGRNPSLFRPDLAGFWPECDSQVALTRIFMIKVDFPANTEILTYEHDIFFKNVKKSIFSKKL